MSLATRLRGLVDAAPPDATVTVRWLRELLEAECPSQSENADDKLLTVIELAAWSGRSVSTARGWCARGLFPGAFRLANREWRIPRSALALFVAAEQRGERSSTSRPRREVNLASWRGMRAG